MSAISRISRLKVVHAPKLLGQKIEIDLHMTSRALTHRLAGVRWHVIRQMATCFSRGLESYANEHSHGDTCYITVNILRICPAAVTTTREVCRMLVVCPSAVTSTREVWRMLGACPAAATTTREVWRKLVGPPAVSTSREVWLTLEH